MNGYPDQIALDVFDRADDDIRPVPPAGLCHNRGIDFVCHHQHLPDYELYRVFIIHIGLVVDNHHDLTPAMHQDLVPGQIKEAGGVRVVEEDVIPDICHKDRIACCHDLLGFANRLDFQVLFPDGMGIQCKPDLG
jgi:hypothetical protein